ncbi:hypothetical protein Salat_1434100 [Sesamum alatum]|uniref:CCHC-type domain-containing protein n=1 Tax=Sesamum alatum TaxID=300844 RepID=A0AAE1YAH3_9LAMI|nr:hypothetical protein Salat_1434100 [Sesamum alatum]
MFWRGVWSNSRPGTVQATPIPVEKMSDTVRTVWLLGLRNCPWVLWRREVESEMRGSPMELTMERLGRSLVLTEDEEAGFGCGSNKIFGGFKGLAVDLDVGQPLKRALRIRLPDSELTVTFTYERLPNFCYGCGVLGHIVRDCPKVLEDPSMGTTLELPYGAWLRESRSMGMVIRPPEQTGRWMGLDGNGREFSGPWGRLESRRGAGIFDYQLGARSPQDVVGREEHEAAANQEVWPIGPKLIGQARPRGSGSELPSSQNSPPDRGQLNIGQPNPTPNQHSPAAPYPHPPGPISYPQPEPSSTTQFSTPSAPRDANRANPHPFSKTKGTNCTQTPPNHPASEETLVKYSDVGAFGTDDWEGRKYAQRGTSSTVSSLSSGASFSTSGEAEQLIPVPVRFTVGFRGRREGRGRGWRRGAGSLRRGAPKRKGSDWGRSLWRRNLC